jgi:hypothetical protein
MAATKSGAKNETVTNDLLAGLVEEAPEPRKNAPRVGAAFQPVESLVDSMTAAFTRSGGVALRRAFATAKDAKSFSRVYEDHGRYIVENNEAFAGKSIAVKVLEITPDFASANDWAKDAAGQYRFKVQLTHARKAKEDAAETPAETPAQ